MNEKDKKIIEMIRMCSELVASGALQRVPKIETIISDEEMSQFVKGYFEARIEVEKAKLKLSKFETRMDELELMFQSLEKHDEIIVEFFGKDCDGEEWGVRRRFKTIEEAYREISEEYEWADGPMAHEVII